MDNELALLTLFGSIVALVFAATRAQTVDVYKRQGDIPPLYTGAENR